MRFLVGATLLTIGLAFRPGADATAQTFYLEPFGGVLIIEDDGVEHLGISVDPSGLIGGVLGYALRPRWELAAAYAFAPAVSQDEDGVETDLFIHAYYGAVNYVAPLSVPWSFVASGGVGGISMDDDTDADPSTDPIFTFGGGLRYDASERFAVQGFVRDHLQLCKGVEEGDDATVTICPEDDSPRHHVEISGGLLILF